MNIVPVNTAAILEAVRIDLATWAQPQNGTADLAQDPFGTIQLLLGVKSGFRVVVHYGDDTNVSLLVNHQATVTVATMKTTLIVSEGFDWQKWRALVTPQYTNENAPGLLDLRDNLRAYILGIRFPETNVPESKEGTCPIHRGMFFYGGTRAVTAPDGLPFRAWELSFKFHHAIKISDATHEVNIP